MFRGDAVKDENQAAVFDDIAASASTSLGGLDLIVAYELLDGNETSTSDCIKAYVQSLLNSSEPTYVFLPIELVPDHAKHIHQPCTPLIKSLYGHPLASASWKNHLSKVLAQELGGFEFEQLPSCFYFPSLRLALSVYVDDLTLSGTSVNHSKFWEVLRKVVQLEDPAPLSNVLGRGHVRHDGGLALHPADFARQCVKLFEELSGKPVKHVRTPHVDEGSLLATDQADRGQLSNVAPKLVMKFMWLGHISRPDLVVAINVCAGHITKSTVNDDKRMTRLAGYVAATLDHCHVMRVLDKPSDLRLSLYADADFGSAPDMRSTSGYLLALEGPRSFALILWCSKRQRAVSRPTTEAEFVSVSTYLIAEAVPLLEICQQLITPEILLNCYEDNQAVLAIIARGFSPKLRHLSKFHKINVASTREAFNEHDINAEYIETLKQRTDVLTKSRSVSAWDSALKLLHTVSLKT